ncbi:MAG: AMP-binding protein [Gammaproteobacteria bacterium]|nr:AMP-binding protein [Gammaproteobacteria bacterium]
MINLSAFSAFHARVMPEAVALIYDDESISWNAFHLRVLRAAALLRDHGIVAGDVVALLMKNSPAFLELAFAASHLGAVLLPVNFRLAAEEVRYITGHAGAKLLAVDDELDRIGRPCDAHLVLDERARHEAGTLAERDSPAPPAAPREPSDLLRLMYTSGTTDHPKGVTISYDNFYWKCIDQVMALGIGRGNRLLTVGPLYHVGALDLPGLAVLWMGGCMCLQRDFDAEAALAAIERHALTCGWMAPVMTNAVLGLEESGRFRLDSFEWLIGGGERTPEQRIREFGRVFPRARYVDAYGMTETVSGDTLMEAGREIEKIGSTGRALAHVEIRIADDVGRSLASGNEGEILIRGPKVTRGYWRDAERTAESFHGDWLRSGDVGYLDDEGFLYLTDRKKDLIISGGENIASSEVERVLYDLDAVSEAAVVGVPDAKWGERPVAVVVLRPGATLDHAAVQAHCREHLAGFKVPGALVVRDALPRNPSGKVLKRVLREELARDAGKLVSGETRTDGTP